MPRQKTSHRIEEAGITRSELANRLNKKNPQITRLLRGDNNFIVKTMEVIPEDLGCNYRPHLEPKDCEKNKPIFHKEGAPDLGAP